MDEGDVEGTGAGAAGGRRVGNQTAVEQLATNQETSMDLQLKGRRALVTGSNSGIGLGIAKMLVEEGAKVVIHGRDRERAEKVARELGAAGVALGDLSNEAGADAAAKAAREVLGG